MKVAAELMVCADCLLVLANDDSTGIDDNAREREVRDAVAALGPHACVGDSDLDDEFSWSACGCCGTSLGGSRHAVVMLER